MLLPYRISDVSTTRLLILLGMTPVILLEDKARKSSFERLQREVEIDPVRALQPAFRNVNCTRLPRELGKDPIIEFLARSNVNSLVKEPITEGMVP